MEKQKKPQVKAIKTKNVYRFKITLNAYQYYSCSLQEKIVSIPLNVKVNVIYENANELYIYSYQHLLLENKKRLFRRALKHIKGQYNWIESHFKDLEKDAHK